jgi:hypothetical protein
LNNQKNLLNIQLKIINKKGKEIKKYRRHFRFSSKMNSKTMASAKLDENDLKKIPQ